MLSSPTRTRAAALLATAALLVTADAAHPAPSCARVLDPAGDGGAVLNFGGTVLPNDAALDLLALDVGARQRDLVAQIQLLRLDRVIDRWYEVAFTIGGTDFYFAAWVPMQTSGEAPQYTAGYFSDTDGDAGGYAPLGDVHGHFDAARSTITFVADSRLLQSRETLRSGTRLQHVHASAYRAIRGADVILSADMTSELEYRFGGPPCFPVPRS